MVINYKKVLFVFLPFLLSKFFLNAQIGKSDQSSIYYNWFDSSVNFENTSLFNGVFFNDRYLTINEKHRFFEVPDFLRGSIDYDGQEYFDLSMKYDVHGDEVLVKLKRGYGEITLQLIKSNVHSFTIDNHRFININKKDDNNTSSIHGFHESLLETSIFILLKKHKKNVKRRERNKVVYYEFLSKNEYVLYYNDSYHYVNNKSDFIKVFPKFKKDIDSYYNASRALKRSNKDLFNQTLLRRIFTLLSKEDN